MTRIFIVEDTPEEAALATTLLQKAGAETTTFADGTAALERLDELGGDPDTATELPDLVLTDLVMPEIDGLEVVEKVRQRFPQIPVILMTAHGSGEISVRALKKGAASYVPKRRLIEDLVESVEDVLAVARAEREQALLLATLQSSEYRFEIGNDQALIATLVGFVRDQLTARFPELDDTMLMQVGMAVQEALRNAMHHGNLEVSSSLRQESSHKYDAMVEERLADAAYGGRKVTVELEISVEELRCVVGDMGPGFDPSTVPDPTDPENLLQASGRGLFLITTFMDEVRHNAKGNEITMVKRLADDSDIEDGLDRF